MPPALARIIVAMSLVALATETAPKTVVPNFKDLTITRTVNPEPGFQGQIETWYFKGPRVRLERPVGPADNPEERIWVDLTQCDKKAHYFEDEQGKSYEHWSIDELLGKDDDIGDPGAGEVVVTYDAVDTGERRQVGSYLARHIKTTTTFAPDANSGARPGKIVSDGWYIDLPGWDLCSENKQEPWWQMELERHYGTPRIVHVWRGVHRGFAIELTTNSTPGIQSPAIEFLGISEQPLDRALFEVPKDYVENPR